MPNWCNNTIELSGPKDKVKAIFDKAKADNELLEQLFPMPAELKDTEKSSDDKKMAAQPMVDGVNNWYDWRVNNWGTKWEVDADNLEYREEGDRGIIQGWFDSAWSPPIHAYEHFLEHNDDCNIKSYYYEGGMDFGGLWEDFDDDCITVSDYNSDQMEDSSSGLIYDLNEHFAFSEWVREYEEEQKTDTERFAVDKEAVNV